MKVTEIDISHISTHCLMRTLLRHLWMIVAAALICAMTASLYVSWIYQPQYRATMTYAVTSRRTSYSTSGNQTATKEVAAVLTEMLAENVVIDGIRSHSEKLSDFDGTISATQVGDSNMIVVNTTAGSPETAFLSMCAVRDQFPAIAGYISNDCIVQVVRNPAVSAAPINQMSAGSLSKTAALLGAGTMALFLCWVCISRETIQTRTGARHLLDAPIIATISSVKRRRKLRRKQEPLQVFAPTTSFAYTEQINTICAHMEHESASKGHKIYMFTGVGEQEGKSTVSANVASALAMMGKTVALVDCDLRNPSLNRFFGNRYASDMPLNRFLSQPFSKDNLLQCMVRHDGLGLYMLFSTAPDRRCTELLTGPTMGKMLEQLRIFDYVIVDTPPMGYFTDTEALIDSVDASILVVRQDRTPAADINDAADLLRRSRSAFLGCVLNDMTASLTEGHRYGYGYGYGYGSKKSSRKRR